MKKLPVLILSLCLSFFLNGQTINTVAGIGVSGFSGDGGQAILAEIGNVSLIANDGKGNIYITDGVRVRVINTSGIINTVAGNGVYGSSGDGGPATSAELDGVHAVAIDKTGNLYISEAYKIRIVNTSGIISTFAGVGSYGFSGDGGPATSAEFESPQGLCLDKTGNLYIADQSNSRIREVITSGIISTFAGNGAVGFSGDGGPASSAELSNPYGLAIDNTGNMYIGDYSNDRIRKINSSGIISTYAGVGIYGYSGDNQPAITVEMDNPTGIAVDGRGNVYFSDEYNYRVRMINPGGIIFTIAGGGISGYSGDGGPATSALVSDPMGVAIDNSNNIYVADAGNYRIRKISVLFSDTVVQTPSSNCLSCNGTASAIVSGGSPAYTYLWSPGGQTTATISGMCPSIDTLLVIDSNGDSLGKKDVIIRSTIINDSSSSTCATCCNCKGTATIYPYGGASPYTYQWSNGRTNDSINGLMGGTYEVSITDANGCKAVDTVFVSKGLNATASATDVSCYGGSDGTATASGGTDYLWSPGGQTTASISGLSAGAYVVTVSDHDSTGCRATLSVTVGQPAQLLAQIFPDYGVCLVNQTMTSIVAGGTPPYTYHWSADGGTNASDMLLMECPLTFYFSDQLTVTDAHGCSVLSNTLNLLGNYPPQFTSVAPINPTCNDSNGSIEVDICTGFTGTNQFTISPPGNSYYTSSSTYTFTHLGPGSYYISVLCGTCVISTNVTLANNPGLTVYAYINTLVSCNGGSNGSANLGETGGTSPYTYLWSNGASATTISGLSAGNYSVIVTDNLGCTGTANVNITQPAPISFFRSSLADNGSCNGSAGVAVSGGTFPYTYSWSPGGQTTDSIYNQCYGSYCCTVTDYHHCTDSACIYIDFYTGTQSSTNGTGIEVSPNPSTGKFNLVIASEAKQSSLSIEVYNVFGQLIYSQSNIQNSTFNINLDQPNGVYFYRVNDESGSILGEGKLIIAR